jgi:hypothetical protein
MRRPPMDAPLRDDGASNPSGGASGARRLAPSFHPEGGAADGEGAIARAELRADIARMRAVHGIALPLWLLTVGLDWAVTTWVVPQTPLAWFLPWRALTFASLAVSVYRMRRDPPPTLAVVRAIDLFAHTGAAFGIAMMALGYKGIASPYAHAVTCVIFARSVAVPLHWREGARLTAPPALAYPLTLLAASMFSPSVRAQLHDPAALTEFALGVSLQLVGAVFGVVGGHAQWALRRATLEARSVGRYQLKERIGRGAMGEVWRAHHPALRRDVAVKLLSAAAPRDGALARFERELRATSELVHPNTVRVFDGGVADDGRLYYAMELLEGETLAQRVKRDGALAPTEATFIALQAARALAEAHRKGIVHRDVKPENLFLASVGEPRALLKVLDFGVAKVLREGGDEAERSITREGALLGTPMFMAPEQGLGEEADARADVYALGCVLYFCLCGAAPFADGPAATIILSHVAKPVPDLRARCPHALSDALVATVARCLEKRPEQRFADAGALADALAALPA